MRATPTGSACAGSSTAFITCSPIFSAVPMKGSLPAGARSRAKTLGNEVMMWKCLECGSRLAKISTSAECVQKPTVARIDRFSGPAPSRIIAISEPAGLGKRLHPPASGAAPANCAVSTRMRWQVAPSTLPAQVGLAQWRQRTVDAPS